MPIAVIIDKRPPLTQQKPIVNIHPLVKCLGVCRSAMVHEPCVPLTGVHVITRGLPKIAANKLPTCIPARCKKIASSQAIDHIRFANTPS